jgi:uncharacterized Zn-binding protein involved in type VI secretion
MSLAARVSDMHVCPMVTPGVPPVPHVGGPILPVGCPTVLIGGMPAARVGDMCMCVGPPDAIVMGSMTVLIGGMPAARMGDPTIHGGTIVLGCPTVLIGDAGGGGGGGAAGAAAGAVAAGVGAGDGGSHPPPQVVAAYATGAAATVAAVPASQAGPVQPRQQSREKTWIGVLLQDHQDRPMPNQDFQITLQSGQIVKGRTDAEGRARFDNLDPDAGQVAFTQLKESTDLPAEQSPTALVEAGLACQDFDQIPLPTISEQSTLPDAAGDEAAPVEPDPQADQDQ